MITVKGLAVIALLVGGTSLAIAQGGQATTGQTPKGTSAPPRMANPAATGAEPAQPFHHPILHRRVYMQAAPSSSHQMAPSSHKHKLIKMNSAPSTTKQ
jgi:hypothetical protein